jgi:hypothetical protein
MLRDTPWGGGFQFLLILDLWGISFHAGVVFGLDKNLLFNPCLAWDQKARKMLMFRATKQQLLKDLMSWTRCQNNPIYLNFPVLKKIQLTKCDLTKTQSGKCPVPCQTGLNMF